MAQDYVLLARDQGLVRAPAHPAARRLRNAVVPTLTLTGVQFTFLIGGTVIVERIFAYPGIGNMAIDAVINRDLPLIQGLVLIFAVLFIADQPRRRSARTRCSIRGCAMADRACVNTGPLARRRAAAGAAAVVAGSACARSEGRRWRRLHPVLIALAIFAPLIAPHDPLEQDLMLATLPPLGFPAPSPATCSAPTASAATCCRASSTARASR